MELRTQPLPFCHQLWILTRWPCLKEWKHTFTFLPVIMEQLIASTCQCAGHRSEQKQSRQLISFPRQVLRKFMSDCYISQITFQYFPVGWTLWITDLSGKWTLYSLMLSHLGLSYVYMLGRIWKVAFHQQPVSMSCNQRKNSTSLHSIQDMALIQTANLDVLSTLSMPSHIFALFFWTVEPKSHHKLLLTFKSGLLCCFRYCCSRKMSKHRSGTWSQAFVKLMLWFGSIP